MTDNNAKHERLLRAILRLMLRKGLKGLTMDLLASDLSMSKRTLYEIFGSKHQLIAETLDYMFGKMDDKCREIFETAPNSISALAEMFHLNGELLNILTIAFFHDIDTLYPDIGTIYKEKRDDAILKWGGLYKRGVSEGVFRENVNIVVLYAMMTVQMEALKRMEGKFAGMFTLQEIYHTITSGFLRSIASHKGLEIIESFQPRNINEHYLDFLNE